MPSQASHPHRTITVLPRRAEATHVERLRQVLGNALTGRTEAKLRAFIRHEVYLGR